MIFPPLCPKIHILPSLPEINRIAPRRHCANQQIRILPEDFMFFRFLLFFCAFFCLLFAGANAKNLIVNGDFAANSDSATGWTIEGNSSQAKVLTENEIHFLRLELEQPGYLMATQKFDVSRDWKGLYISGRIRMQGLKKGAEPHNTATLLYGFNNERGEHVGPWFQTMIHNDQPWTDIEDHVEGIPDGATTLIVQAALMDAAGRADFTNLRVEPERIGDPPPGVVLAGGEPIEDLRFGHGRICLNGVWHFQSAIEGAESEPIKESWGLIRVPGSWVPNISDEYKQDIPAWVYPGAGKLWQNWDGSKVTEAWYERRLDIPEEWNSRSILLDLNRVSTGAEVFVDGKKAGEVTWPGGQIDLTAVVQPGSSHVLRLLVSASHDRAKTINAMGVGQNTLVDAKLASRGVIGEAFLYSRPQGARVDSVWVRTSVRNKELEIDADLVDVKAAGTVRIKAVVRDEKNKVVKIFKTKADIAKGNSTITIVESWANPKLWDVAQPNLYTLDLFFEGEALNAGFRQRFGFREVWIDNRTIYLNGKPFRLRPTSIGAGFGNPTTVESLLKNILGAGFNIAEIWPENYTERGSVEYSNIISDIADRVGMPLMGQTRHAVDLFEGKEGFKWDAPTAREDWLRLMKEEWKTYRNNPSILIWSSSGNIGGHIDDQDPRRIGRGLDAPIWQLGIEEWDWNRNLKLQEMVERVKSIDPTRPYMIHQGGAVGDIYSVNNYLCLIPLQEREEWLSDWAEHGTRPFCSVEFGTPLSTTMHRGRDGFVFSTPTEPLATEFTAAYLGREAYALETQAYRKGIVSQYVNGQVWRWPPTGYIDFEPDFQRLEEIFVANTWKSWRTMGITAGMVPWAKAHGFEDLTRTVKEPFQPGRRGTYSPVIEQKNMTPFGGNGVKTHPSGVTLLANNGPTLAWIAGAKVEGDIASFTQKDHSFRPGETVHKQAVLINDSRRELPWSFTVTSQLDGKPLETVTKSGRIQVGETLFVPLDFAMPAEIPVKQTGEIKLEAKIGEASHADSFFFHVFPSAGPLSGKVAVFDPEGHTSRLLQGLGLTVSLWKGEDEGTLIIGRNALSSGNYPPASLEDYVKNGGRLLIMAQNPEWLKFIGLRVSELMSRRVFRIDNAHPVAAGLDDTDLRDWRGFSTLLDPKPDYTKPGIPRSPLPTWGWRWGSRGTVSSASIEKPHRSGWRPLMEAEFDLAYSPLMELDFGKGRVVLSTLDLEDHAALDPAADLLASNLLQYVMTAPLVKPPGRAIYVGNEEGARLLDLIGADYSRAATVDPSAPLVVLGPDVSVDTAAPVLEKGGRVLVLPRHAAGPAGLGIEVVKNDNFSGSMQVPQWREVRGLSVSDLRWRTNAPALVLKGAGVEADGLLARVEKGSGIVVFIQADPQTLPADEKQYLRFTRWRETRTLAQVLANLGGSFALDNQLFKIDRIKLDGQWKVCWTQRVPSSRKPIRDTGISSKAIELVKTDADESGMEEVILPSYWTKMDSAEGEAVFRRKFQVPLELIGRELVINLGIVDDFDDTFINGVKIGSTDGRTPNTHSVERHYIVPAGVLKAGENVVAVRVFDAFGGGGIRGSKRGIHIAPKSVHDDNFYHSDYRGDFALGDDPYRYYRW